MKIKLAEALLLRKELQGKVDRLAPIDTAGMFETRVRRQSVADGVDEVVANVPKVSMQQVSHCYNWHARALRTVDALIQQTNWTAEIDLEDKYLNEYVDPYIED